MTNIAKRVGVIPACRIRPDRPPGAAEVADTLDIEADEDRVEKVAGAEESILSGAAGWLKFARGPASIPDVSFVSAARRPGGTRSAGVPAQAAGSVPGTG
jgi:hypothetical protein